MKYKVYGINPQGIPEEEEFLKESQADKQAAKWERANYENVAIVESWDDGDEMMERINKPEFWQ